VILHGLRIDFDDEVAFLTGAPDFTSLSNVMLPRFSGPRRIGVVTVAKLRAEVWPASRKVTSSGPTKALAVLMATAVPVGAAGLVHWR